MDCVFCKIVQGEIPSYKVYEDDKTLAFLDIMPVHHGHTLVIAKEHHENLEEIPQDLLNSIMATVKKVGKSIKDNLAEDYNASTNNGPAAGQVIPHVHFHVIPRNKGDNLHLWPQAEYPEGEAEETLKKIKIS